MSVSALSFSGVGPGPNLPAEGEEISEGDLQFRTRWDSGLYVYIYPARIQFFPEERKPGIS